MSNTNNELLVMRMWGAEPRRAVLSKAQQGKHGLAWHRRWGEDMGWSSTLQMTSLAERKTSLRGSFSWGLSARRRGGSGSQELV